MVQKTIGLTICRVWDYWCGVVFIHSVNLLCVAGTDEGVRDIQKDGIDQIMFGRLLVMSEMRRSINREELKEKKEKEVMVKPTEDR